MPVVVDSVTPPTRDFVLDTNALEESLMRYIARSPLVTILDQSHDKLEIPAWEGACPGNDSWTECKSRLDSLAEQADGLWLIDSLAEHPQSSETEHPKSFSFDLCMGPCMTMAVFLDLAAQARRNVAHHPCLHRETQWLEEHYVLAICDVERVAEGSSVAHYVEALTSRIVRQQLVKRKRRIVRAVRSKQSKMPNGASGVDIPVEPGHNSDVDKDRLEEYAQTDVLDELLNEIAIKDALQKCDELLVAFMKHSPLNRQCNIRQLQDMEWEIAHPLDVICLGSHEEQARIMDMPEHDRTLLIEGTVKSSTHARDCFLAAVMGYDWFFDDVERDEAARRRGWGWNE